MKLQHRSLLILISPVVAKLAHGLVTVPWKTGRSVVDGLIEQLTPDEKVSLLHGGYDPNTGSQGQNQAGYINPIPRLGIPQFRLSDGENGLNLVDDATGLPSQLNVAASFSRDIAFKHGSVAGLEAKILGMGTVLAPRLNILRDVVEGSFWQSYSEDPYLTSQLGLHAMSGIQSHGTMANAKQLAASSTGASNGDANSIVDLQTLHEVYLPAFEYVLKSGVATIMCSYVAINGEQSCQNTELIHNTVRGDWNYTGLIMSDWTATHSTAPSIIAGLDLEMPYGVYFASPLYQSVYVSKNLSETYIDRALGHLLGMYDDYGLLGHPGPTTAPLQQPLINQSATVAYDIAVKSGVLLKNDDSTLPIDGHRQTIAVLGPNGLIWNHGAGFAERAYGFKNRQTTVYNALQSRIGQSSIPSSVGTDLDGSVIPEGSLINLNGTAGLSRNDSTGSHTTDSVIDFSGASALPASTSYQWNGYLKCEETGFYRISLQRAYFETGDGQNNSAYSSFSASSLSVNGSAIASGYRLFLDGGIRPWSTPMASADGRDNIGNYVYLEAGTHPIQVIVSPILDQNVTVRLNWVTPSQREKNIQNAVSLAEKVDKPIVFAYANSAAQVAMTLDDGGDELIERVAAANPNTIVVLNNAEPVMMPWLGKVKAVLQMFSPGQEGGWATADLLLGNAQPQGRLPVTYPTSVNTSVTRNPAYPGRVNGPNGTATFSEGLNIGYRWFKHSNTPVLFPFGYGLSYTEFSYSALTVAHTGAGLQVSFWLENTGETSGTEVPQVYIGPPSDTAEYPEILFAAQVLVGFDSFDLCAGQRTRVVLDIDERWLSFYNKTDRQWVLPKGTRPLWVGASAEESKLRTAVTF